MSSLVRVVFVCILICSLSCGLSHFSLKRSDIDRSSNVFPLYLKTIQSEAFSGTAFESVIFNNKLIYIGTKAFDNVDRILLAYLPQSIRTIEDGAFSQSVSIHGVENSYAQYWAEINGNTFIVDDIWNARVCEFGICIDQLLVLLFCIIPKDNEDAILCLRRIRASLRSMRPQDRPELYPINYRFP